jgi:hypothetical protein
MSKGKKAFTWWVPKICGRIEYVIGIVKDYRIVIDTRFAYRCITQKLFYANSLRICKLKKAVSKNLIQA